MAQGDNVALPLARWPGPAATLRVDGWEQSPLGCLTHQSPTVALPALATAEVVVPALELLSPPRCVELQAQHLGLGTLCSRESEDRAAGATCAADSELCCGVGCVGRERCTVRLPRGARVALRAIADSESSFAEWSGACQQRDSCWLLGEERSLKVQARFPLRTRSHGSVWWNPIPLAGALYRIVAQGPQRGVAVGELGMVLTLNEQGLSGSAVNVSSSLRAVLPLGLGDSEQRWLAGDGGTLLLQRGGSVVDHSVATCAMGCDLLALSGDNGRTPEKGGVAQLKEVKVDPDED